MPRPALCGGSHDQVCPETKSVKQADGKGASAAEVMSRRGRHYLPVVRLGCNFTGGLTEGAKSAHSQLTDLFEF